MQALPRAAGSHHYSFRVLLTILHQKDVPLEAQDSLSDPTRPPAAVSTAGPPTTNVWGTRTLAAATAT